LYTHGPTNVPCNCLLLLLLLLWYMLPMAILLLWQ
jgi:hypothetical protein